MKYLEELDAQDRNDGTSRMERLRQIPPETGRFIALMALQAPEGELIEIGTSAGYSSLWLSLACRRMNRIMTTFEILPDKARLAKETFALTDTDAIVKLEQGDARIYINKMNSIAFCFLDAEKEIYEECYDLVVPRMVSGGILIADNALSHKAELGRFLEKVDNDNRVDAIVIPIGKGELIARKI